MYIRIFDFDQTITKHHTFQRPELFNSDNNIKTGIGEFFLHDKENVSVVATYRDNPEYVKSYIEKILNKKLTLQNTIDYKNDRLNEENFLTWCVNLLDHVNKNNNKM